MSAASRSCRSTKASARATSASYRRCRRRGRAPARHRHRRHQRGRICQRRRLAALHAKPLRRLHRIAAPDGKPLIEQGKDRDEFADFYQYASERGTLFFAPGAQIAKKRPVQACTGPVTYVGQAELKKEIDVTIAAAGKENVFLTSTAPASLEVYRRNRHYKNDEEYVFALAEAMRVEYEAIAESRPDRASRRCLAAGAVGSHRHGDGSRCVPRPERNADRSAQSCAAQHSRRADALSSVLGQLARPARLRPRDSRASPTSCSK